MTPKGSNSGGQGKLRGRPSKDLDEPYREKLLLSLWFGKENEYLRRTDIIGKMSLIYGIPDSWTRPNLTRMATEGRLEKKLSRYRPIDYFAEFSPAVPIRLMEESPTFLSVPLSPYNWITIHGFPGLEEMTCDEAKRLLLTLLDMEKSLRDLYDLRTEVATRLGQPQVAENLELLKENIREYLLKGDPSHSAGPSPSDNPTGENGKDSPSDVEKITDLPRRVWLSREWERYVETPLVGSFSILSHILKVISPEFSQETPTLNFQFYNYVFRILEVASSSWRVHLEREGLDERSVSLELRRKGLDPEGIGENSMSICKSAIRRMLREGRKHLYDDRKTLNEILKKIQETQEGSEVPEDVEDEIVSLLLTRVLGPVAEDPFYAKAMEAVESFRAKGGAFTPPLVERIVKEMLADIKERYDTFVLLDSELDKTRKLSRFLSVTRGFMAPFPEQLKSWELDLKGLVRNYFPPSMSAG